MPPKILFVKNHDVLDRLASISWSDAQGQARNYIWPMALQGAVGTPDPRLGSGEFQLYLQRRLQPEDVESGAMVRSCSQRLPGLADCFRHSRVAGLLVAVRSLPNHCLEIVAHARREERSHGTSGGYAVHNVFVFDNWLAMCCSSRRSHS